MREAAFGERLAFSPTRLALGLAASRQLSRAAGELLPCATAGERHGRKAYLLHPLADAGCQRRSAWPLPLSALNEVIVEAIAATGCYVGASVIDAVLVRALRSRVGQLRRSHQLLAAQVGRAHGRTATTAMRGDSIAWLDQDALAPAELAAMTVIDSLRGALNAALFLGAMDTECHYARYPRGAGYRTHIDRFSDHDRRVVSFVFYLNNRWREQHGGELLIHHQDTGTAQRVLPRSGTMVAFLSDRFPHEVMPATRPRLALTGWMRRRALVGQ